MATIRERARSYAGSNHRDDRLFFRCLRDNIGLRIRGFEETHEQTESARPDALRWRVASGEFRKRPLELAKNSSKRAPASRRKQIAGAPIKRSSERQRGRIPRQGLASSWRWDCSKTTILSFTSARISTNWPTDPHWPAAVQFAGAASLQRTTVSDGRA
jgi:hypothetical protein